jgi:hypothetical protein
MTELNLWGLSDSECRARKSLHTRHIHLVALHGLQVMAEFTVWMAGMLCMQGGDDPFLCRELAW